MHDPDHQDFIVFLVEHYGYFVLSANLRGSPPEENIRLGLEFSTSILPLVKGFSSFGSVFAFEPAAFSLVPQIAQLARQRRQGASAPHDQLCRVAYVQLLDSLNHEQRSSGGLAELGSPESGSWDKRQVVISIKINALLMFLHATFYEHCRSSAWIRELLQPLIDRTMMLLTHVEEIEACYGIFWSVLVVGSYIRDHVKQEQLIRQLRTNESSMLLLEKGVDLLQWLWTDHDHTSFGLKGLEKIAAAHGVALCIC